MPQRRSGRCTERSYGGVCNGRTAWAAMRLRRLDGGDDTPACGVLTYWCSAEAERSARRGCARCSRASRPRAAGTCASVTRSSGRRLARSSPRCWRAAGGRRRRRASRTSGSGQPLNLQRPRALSRRRPCAAPHCRSQRRSRRSSPQGWNPPRRPCGRPCCGGSAGHARDPATAASARAAPPGLRRAPARVRGRAAQRPPRGLRRAGRPRRARGGRGARLVRGAVGLPARHDRRARETWRSHKR